MIATLNGTVNPELIYVVSSHYDSVAAGPGADDDSTGTAALLETARLLAGHPQPATIIFASFTGEEAGLLGSREFVRRAVADKKQVVGALNNDMVGWANDYRLDNTIRYSNPGIRDVQHAAAMQFTSLITYDALYYKGTDAASYYEAYGDIVGGIGSYPVLGNPHYHQPHDFLETINHQLVTEVAKTTVATLMLLASSPSRLTGADRRAFRRRNGDSVVEAERRKGRHRLRRRIRPARQARGATNEGRQVCGDALERAGRDYRFREGDQLEGSRRMGLGTGRPEMIRVGIRDRWSVSIPFLPRRAETSRGLRIPDP